MTTHFLMSEIRGHIPSLLQNHAAGYVGQHLCIFILRIHTCFSTNTGHKILVYALGNITKLHSVYYAQGCVQGWIVLFSFPTFLWNWHLNCQFVNITWETSCPSGLKTNWKQIYSINTSLSGPGIYDGKAQFNNSICQKQALCLFSSGSLTHKKQKDSSRS